MTLIISWLTQYAFVLFIVSFLFGFLMRREVRLGRLDRVRRLARFSLGASILLGITYLALAFRLVEPTMWLMSAGWYFFAYRDWLLLHS